MDERNKSKYGYLSQTMRKPYLNENRESVAGHGCAIKISLRAYVEITCEFTSMEILLRSEGLIRSSMMLSSICKEYLSQD